MFCSPTRPNVSRFGLGSAADRGRTQLLSHFFLRFSAESTQISTFYTKPQESTRDRRYIETLSRQNYVFLSTFVQNGPFPMCFERNLTDKHENGPDSALNSGRLAQRGVKGLIEVLPQVFDPLDADRQPEQAGRQV